MKKFLQFGKYIKVVIDFFGGFKKVFLTMEAFKEHLESFEDERQKIWKKDVKEDKNSSEDVVKKDTEVSGLDELLTKTKNNESTETATLQD